MVVFIIILFVWIILLQTKVNTLDSAYIALKNKVQLLESKIRLLTEEIESNKKSQNANYEISNSQENIKPEQDTEVIEPSDNEQEENQEQYEQLDVKFVDTSDNSGSKIENINSKESSNNKNISNISMTNNGFEEIFMGNIFNKIGAVAILIGVCILVKLISSYIEFTDVMKISLSYFAGLGMIFGALKMQKTPNLKKFAEVLLGTGFGTLLITTYCATSLMEMFNLQTATTIASAIIIAIYYLADKQKTKSMLVIGLIGGYINPFFINRVVDVSFLFNYLIFLNILSLVFVYRNRDKQAVNIFNLIATAITIACYSISPNSYSIFQCITLWVIYLVFDMLMIKQEEKVIDSLTTQTYLNFGVLTALSWLLFQDNYLHIGLLLSSTSIIYLILGILNNSKFSNNKNSYFLSGLLSVFLATYFLTDNILRISLWSIEGLIFTYLMLKFNFKYFSQTSFGFLLPAIINIFFVKHIFQPVDYPETSICFLIPIISGYLMSVLFKKSDIENLCKIFKFISITLIYTFIIILINSILDMNYDEIYLNLISYAVICFVYGTNLILQFGISQSTNRYKLLGICSCIAGISLVLASETHSANNVLPFINLRLIPYTVMAGVSYILYKKEKYDFYNFMAITSGYLFVLFEILNQLHNKTSLIGFMLYSSLGLIYAINLLLTSKKDNDIYRVASESSTIIFITMLLINELVNYSNMFTFFNLRLLSYGLATTNIFLLVKRNNNEWLKYMAVVLGFAFIHFESVNIVNNFEIFNINWLITFMWTLYAGIVSLFGIFKNKKFLKMSGIWLSIFVILRLFIFDFAGLDMLFKLLAFLTLGIVLMVVSYFYNKSQKQ